MSDIIRNKLYFINHCKKVVEAFLFLSTIEIFKKPSKTRKILSDFDLKMHL
jgi:hypothetical protein